MSKTTPDKLPKTFWWANMAQFGGAMNDNLFKLFMIYALIAWGDADSSASILASVGLAFALPFLLITPVAGSFADHFSKRQMIVILKAVEIGVMGFGVFALSMGNSAMLYVTMVLMSSQSAFYGPCKYGIIPEIVETQRISRANGMLQLFTFLAILSGTIIAPELSLKLGSQYSTAALICLAVAVVGFLASLKIEPTPPHPHRKVSLNGFVNLYQSVQVIKKDGFLSLAILAISFFSLVAAFTQLNVLNYGDQHLGLSPEQSTRLFLLTAAGIGCGSALAGWLSGRLIEFGIVPIGAAMMCGCLMVLGLMPQGSLLLAEICMLCIGIGAGLYIVPLESFIQYRSPRNKVGSVKAANGFLSWIGILCASGLIFLNSSILEWTAQQGFLVLAFMLLGLTVMSFLILPDFLVKFIIMCLTRIVYRLRVFGINNLPSDRAALLVCNHVSLMDAILVVSSQQRRIRNLMSRNVYNKANWFTRKIVDLAGVILIQDTDGPKKLLASLQTARKALDDGFLVCVFAEGALTLTGMMRPFKPGFERIIKGTEYPIIPVYIGGAWGSASSWKEGFPKIRPFREFRYPVSVHFGKEIPSTSTVAEVQQAVCEVSSDTFEEMKAYRPSLARSFISVARRNWNRIAVADGEGTELSYGQLLTTALALREEIRKKTGTGDKRIAILMPNSVEGVLANLALSLDGRLTVNVDFTASTDTLRQIYQEADVRTAVVSRKLIDANPSLALPNAVIIIEDALADCARKSMWWTQFLSRFDENLGLLCRNRNFDPDEIATIQFSHGTTGQRRGVLLSHYNLLTNVEALRGIIRPLNSDALLGVFPFYHILGYSITLWFPLLSGLKVVYQENPLDVNRVGEIAERFQVSILPATPALLETYCEGIQPEQFSHLRYVFSGATRLDEALAERFKNLFGVFPLEGYGATELSPVCAISLPDVQMKRFRETGTRKDHLGRLLPGVSVKVLDPMTLLPLPPGEIGLVHVKGPNVMRGYLDSMGKKDSHIKEGWYNTGDLGTLSADGFLAVSGKQADL